MSNMTIEQLEARILELENDNKLLRKTIEIQKEQLRRGGMSDEVRRLRQKIAEWEASSDYMNGGYYHGSRFIKAFRDQDEDA